MECLVLAAGIRQLDCRKRTQGVGGGVLGFRCIELLVLPAKFSPTCRPPFSPTCRQSLVLSVMDQSAWCVPSNRQLDCRKRTQVVGVGVLGFRFVELDLPATFSPTCLPDAV